MRKIVILILMISILAFPISLWKKAQMNLISVKKATDIGDIVKVVVYEIPIASLKTNSGNPVSAVLGFFEELLTRLTGLIPSNYVPTNVNSSISRKNEASAKIVLEIASLVVGKDEHGNLIIEGRKRIKVGSEVKEIVVKGKIRPEDISADNTVDSRNMAEAEIWIGDDIVFKKSPEEPDSWLAYFASLIAGLFM